MQTAGKSLGDVPASLFMQYLNKLPGQEVITSKVMLSMSNLTFMPRAFRIPEDSTSFREYARQNPEAKFIFKDVKHKGIKVVANTSDKLLKNINNVFVQELTTNPLLIKGYKFDLGVYAIITAINPLRIYVFNGKTRVLFISLASPMCDFENCSTEIQIRFCLKKYHPINPDYSDVKKYIVLGHYNELWNVPGLEGVFPDYSVKDAISMELKEGGFDPE